MLIGVRSTYSGSNRPIRDPIDSFGNPSPFPHRPPSVPGRVVSRNLVLPAGVQAASVPGRVVSRNLDFQAGLFQNKLVPQSRKSSPQGKLVSRRQACRQQIEDGVHQLLLPERPFTPQDQLAEIILSLAYLISFSASAARQCGLFRLELVLWWLLSHRNNSKRSQSITKPRSE